MTFSDKRGIPISKSKGYLSDTVNSFQLGKITENQWVANEFLLFPDTPIPFSVITTTYVEALEITKKAMLDKLSTFHGYANKSYQASDSSVSILYNRLII